MLQATLRDWHMLSTTASVPWLRQVIDRSLPLDAEDDEVVTVDVLVNTSPVSASPDVVADWVVDRACEFGLASVERQADALIEGVTCWRAPDGTARSSIPQRHVHYAPMGVDWVLVVVVPPILPSMCSHSFSHWPRRPPAWCCGTDLPSVRLPGRCTMRSSTT